MNTKLSDIVGYYNQLCELNIDSQQTAVIMELKKILSVADNGPVTFDQIQNNLQSAKDRSEKYLNFFNNHLDDLKKSTLELIKEKEVEYFTDSTNLYKEGMSYDSPEYILDRKINMDYATSLFLRHRLQLYPNWLYPGLVLRPAHAPWIEDLVALDPLYLVDTDQRLLEPTTKWFTPEYQNRLRRYAINETDRNRLLFWNFPKDVFGFVYAFNFFHFKPFDLLQSYLGEIYTLLRPGGTLMLNFNDCDYQGAVKLCEHHFCCYTPGRLVRQHAEAVGYIITHSHYDESGTSWLELTKPGHKHSNRGGQALASIWSRNRPVVSADNALRTVSPDIVDAVPEKVYNEVDMLLDMAKILSIDVSQATVNGKIHIKRLRRYVSDRINTISEQHLKEKVERLFNKRTDT